MDNLIAPAGLKLGIFRCLKAGTNVGFPDQGTPQGGVVSPLLANIALNGIESIHSYNTRYNKKGMPTGYHIEPSIRYADDMVIILRPEDNAEAILYRISEFLAERGMNVSERKTKVTAISPTGVSVKVNSTTEQPLKLLKSKAISASHVD